MVKTSVILLFTVLLMSCQKTLEPQAYLAWFSNPENGLRQDKKVNRDIELSVMYQNDAYQKANDLVKERVVNDTEKGNDFFQFRMKLIEGGNIMRYNQNDLMNEKTRINHFGFEAKNDFYLVSGDDTLACKLCVFSRNYNLSPTLDLTLQFDDFKKDKDIQLIYNDRQFNIGRVKFLIEANDLNNIPKLSY